MSEANILNPSATSPYNPDYPIGRTKVDRISRFTAMSGEEYARETLVAGRTLDLTWSDRLHSEAKYLERWQAQYERGFFSFYDIERSRYYSGRFAGPLQTTNTGNDRVTVKGTFVEMLGKPLYAYPSDWDNDAIFIEERDDDGNQLVKTVGTWASYSSSSQHGGKSYSNNSGSNAETAEWKYIGYGFRVWMQKEPNAGIFEVRLDDVFLNWVDVYAAVAVDSAPVYTKVDVPFGRHRVKIFSSETKNPASGGYYLYADAIEVMI